MTVANNFASHTAVGDCYCLQGEVGVGKSCFSRAFIREAADDMELPVPSPTFLLVNVYDEQDGVPIFHFDLYRLSGELDLGRVGFDEALRSGVCLVEWAENLRGLRPDRRMDIAIEAVPEADEGLYRHLVTAEDLSAGSYVDSGDEEDSDEGDLAYADRKWRLITFTAHGERMAGKLRRLEEALRCGEAPGLRIVGSGARGPMPR